MYDETEYIYQEFQKHFSAKKKEPVALYGLGKNTGELLGRIQSYNIAGLMDGKKKEGVKWGKPILDYEDVLKLNVKTIVVIARPAVIGVIYHRISDFCMNNGITVYDVNGNNLAEMYANQENDIPYFHKNIRDLEEEVKKHDIISFDVFDTLVMRKVLYPSDIFTIVEKKLNRNKDKLNFEFAALREEAERQLYDEKKNPNLDEIYDRLQQLSGIGEAYRNELLELEIATEMEFLVPRKRMLEFFNQIKEKKKIYLISDMYLSQKIIAKILQKCGYEGYEELYVSCEKRTSKRERLYDIYIQDRKKDGYACSDCLHIGDNEAVDIRSAEEAGLDAFHIMSARELLEVSTYHKLLVPKLRFLDHLTIGLLCERAFQDPFVLYGTKGKLEINDLKDFTHILIAPAIFYFSVWLMQKVCQMQCDYILYPSRDAYLIEKMCKLICGSQSISRFPDGEYFYVSRRAVLAAAIWNENDILRVAKLDFDGSIAKLFQERFSLSIDEAARELKAGDDKELNNYLAKYKQDILTQSAKERDNYLGYIMSTGIAKHQTFAFIDFVSAGKIQNGLEKLLQEKEILGFYFLKRQPDRDEIDRKIKVESFFPSKGAFEIDLNVYKYYLFLEMVLTSPEPTFHSVADDGRMCFMKETRTSEHCNIVKEIQEGILEYTKEFAALYPNLLSECVCWNVPDMILGFLGQEYTMLNIQDVTSLVLTDEFYSQTFNIFQA